MILNLCLHLFLSRGAAPLLPLVSAFSGKQPRGSCSDRLVPDLPTADFIKHALSVTVHPMAQPCPLPSRLVYAIVSAAKLAEDLVAHRWELFETVLKKHHELSAARKAWRASLVIWQLGLSSFSALVGRSWLRGQTPCCTTSPASLSSVLRLFLAYCHPNLCTQPFLCPSFGQMFLNVMLN